MSSSQTPRPAPARLLILGGTAEARALAAALVAAGNDVITSLAGRVRHPALPAGEVRIGGFGGVDGLADYLRANRIGLVVDATHPFAARISASAVSACERSSLPLVRLARPGWSKRPEAGSWTWVADHHEAADAARGQARVFLTTGRQSIDDFGALSDQFVLLRVVDPPEVAIPDGWTVITSRGPYEIDGERRIMSEHRIDTLITKDSGGTHTTAKLDAAAELGVRVIVVRRPRYDAPQGDARPQEHVESVAAAVDRVREIIGDARPQ